MKVLQILFNSLNTKFVKYVFRCIHNSPLAHTFFLMFPYMTRYPIKCNRSIKNIRTYEWCIVLRMETIPFSLKTMRAEKNALN